MRANPRRRRRRNTHHLRRRRNVRRRRRNPSMGRRHRVRHRNPFGKTWPQFIIDGVAGGVGGVAGLVTVKTLDGLYTFPLFQTTNIPGTTATIGDTLQSVLHAGALTLAAAYVRRKAPAGRSIAYSFMVGVTVGAWFSVISDLVQSITGLPSSIQSALSGYPRGMGAIAPGATYMPSLTAGPVFNPNARMMGYPAVMGGRGF
jgi:hypothetical protein